MEHTTLSCVAMAFSHKSRDEISPWLFSHAFVIPVCVARVFDRCQRVLRLMGIRIASRLHIVIREKLISI